ncbi:MAG: hypothetical protein FWG89_06550 [Treponema sp.]|nr:hypothetical protein [Treponema sp.]
MSRRLFFLLLLFFLAAVLPARGNREKETAIRVTGTVRLVGNEPFAELIIQREEGHWYINPEDEHKLRNLQHRTVTVEGIETVVELRFASGRPAGERRTLKNIRILGWN